jgi:uncharacterized protein (TIGR02145 family)
MMVDGKYSDDNKTNSAWDESWVSGNYYSSGAPGSTANADKNNARGGTAVKEGGRGICPMGWHIPTDREWAQMFDKVEGDGTGVAYTELQNNSGWLNPADPNQGVGVKLRSASTYTDPNPYDGSWLASALPGTNDYGFNAVPTDGRTSLGGVFWPSTTSARWHTTSVSNDHSSWQRQITSEKAGARRAALERYLGLAVRCRQN